MRALVFCQYDVGSEREANDSQPRTAQWEKLCGALS
jgi:hypothetical protein